MIVTFCAYDGRGQVNGPNIWLRRLLPQLRARGIDARVLLLLTAPPTECATLRALEAAGVPCRATPWPDSTWARVRWLLGELRATRPAVFVPNVMVPAYYAARWARAAGIATVGVLHSDDAFHHALVERFVAGAPRDRLNALVCVSRELETLARAAGGEVGTQITRIPYGVPVPNTMASAPTSELRLLYVGRLVEAQKRASDVARALCQAACELPGVTAALYGAGGARPAVERIIGAAGVGERVKLGGELLADQVQPTMLGAHALVLLSDYEGLPIALLEAMACGLVPICTPMRSGIGELVEHELTGLLVADRGDGFVAAVRRLRDEPGLWQRLSLAARAHAVKHYGELSAAQRWAELLSSLPNTAALREVERPWRLQLPPTHPAFAREDHRGPPIASGVLRRGRVLLGELRRKRSGR